MEFKSKFPIVNRGLIIGFNILRYFFKSVWAAYQILLGVILVTAFLFFFKAANHFKYFQIKSLEHSNPAVTAFMEQERARIVSDPAVLGQVLKERKNLGRESIILQHWLPANAIPGMLKSVAIVAEDGKFYQHEGFDIEQIEYAIVANHQAGRQARGASTISQQVVKNLYLTGRKDFLRKMEEAVMAMLMERFLTKDRILEIYLNIAQFGPGVFGVEAGAEYHFKKPARELSFDETVTLISLLPSPLKWRPGCGYLAFSRHRLRIVRNLELYKSIRSSIPDDEYAAFLEFSEQEEQLRWEKLRKSEAVDSSGGKALPADPPRLVE